MKKMKKLIHLPGLHGLGDIVGLGIRIITVSTHMIFIMEISEAKVKLRSNFLYQTNMFWILLLYMLNSGVTAS